MMPQRSAIFTLCLLLCQSLSSGETYGQFKIGTRGKNPARLKWEDVSRIYSDFRDRFLDAQREFARETHNFFHGKFSEYFNRLSVDLKAELVKKYTILFEEEGSLKSYFTFQEVFQIGPTPSDVLFPLNFPDFREKIPMESLKGLVLRDKDGKEKGKIQDRKLTSGDYRLLEYRYEVLTPSGELQEESGFAADALNIRWMDLADKVFVNTREIGP